MTESNDINVLVVDDDDLVRSMVITFLRSGPFNVKEVNSGKKCLKVVQKRPPDVILLDIMMPHMSGLDVLKKLKESILSFAIPVIMVTGMDDRQTIQKAMHGYAEHYIVKPFTQKDLITAIQRAVRK